VSLQGVERHLRLVGGEAAFLRIPGVECFEQLVWGRDAIRTEHFMVLCAMRLLTEPEELRATVARLLRGCTSARWAVAWASTHAPQFEALLRHREKLEQLTVGIHFYQTDPGFIDAFRDHPAAGFVLQPSGTFHPKLYYFESGAGRWDCIVGSANFTRAAFSYNVEVAVHISNRDSRAESTRAQIIAALDEMRTAGKYLSARELARYRQHHARQQKRLQPLSGLYGSPAKKGRLAKSPLDVALFQQSWDEYAESIRHDAVHSIDGRLAVLEEAGRRFATLGSLAKMTELERQEIAGHTENETLRWLWFGSMKGHGYFKSAIKQNNLGLSSALDLVPLTGSVTRADFEAFAEKLQASFDRAGVGTATRLLAFKRPDYFVCLDSKNRKALCKEFGVPANVSLSNYWPRIMDRILDSNWWNAPEPSNADEKRLWRCRAAMLDVLFYDPA